jgi:hypothetical protein
MRVSLQQLQWPAASQSGHLGNSGAGCWETDANMAPQVAPNPVRSL